MITEKLFVCLTHQLVINRCSESNACSELALVSLLAGMLRTRAESQCRRGAASEFPDWMRRLSAYAFFVCCYSVHSGIGSTDQTSVKDSGKGDSDSNDSDSDISGEAARKVPCNIQPQANSEFPSATSL